MYLYMSMYMHVPFPGAEVTGSPELLWIGAGT